MRAGASTARLGASVLDRYERRTRTGSKIGIVQLSDPSGQYEAILFQEGLNQFRDLLEKGSDVLVTLQASLEGEDVRARIVNVERLNDAAAKVHKGLRIFVRDAAPLDSIEARLKAPGDGEVSLVVILGPKEGEVEIRLPGRYAVKLGNRRRAQSRPGRRGGGARLTGGLCAVSMRWRRRRRPVRSAPRAVRALASREKQENRPFSPYLLLECFNTIACSENPVRAEQDGNRALIRA